MAEEGVPVISSSRMEVYPQGSPGPADDLLPNGGFGYLNEQVVWIRHDALADSRSALRVPEGMGWKGKQRVEPATPEHHNYQVGQCWATDGDAISYSACPISNAQGGSPGTISASVDFAGDESVRVQVTVENSCPDTLSNVSCHFCLNHRRAPLLGRSVSAMAEAGWVDFRQYVSSGPYRHYHFHGDKPADLPHVALPALFSEAQCESGPITCAIACPNARTLMSNVDWPCTDVGVYFGDVPSGESVVRSLYVFVGLGDKDAMLSKVESTI